MSTAPQQPPVSDTPLDLALAYAAVTRRITDHGYVELKVPEHPLARRDGWVAAHRATLYDALGPDDQACHWCGWALPWRHEGGYRRCVCVDHVNAVRTDNRPENLVPSCWWCNANRSWEPYAPQTWVEMIATFRHVDPADRDSAIIWLAERAEVGLENAQREADT